MSRDPYDDIRQEIADIYEQIADMQSALEELYGANDLLLGLGVAFVGGILGGIAIMVLTFN